MDALSAEAFDRIKRYILALGGRQTYCNMYNRNPHHRFGTFDAFLTPDVGQRNINCDPERSDFDEIVVQDWSLAEPYLSARLVDGALELRGDPAIVCRYFAAMLAEATAS